MPKMAKKCGNYAIETLIIFLVLMIISSLLIAVAEFKIGDVSSKSYLVSCGVFLFLVTLILFEKIQLY